MHAADSARPTATGASRTPGSGSRILEPAIVEDRQPSERRRRDPPNESPRSTASCGRRVVRPERARTTRSPRCRTGHCPSRSGPGGSTPSRPAADCARRQAVGHRRGNAGDEIPPIATEQRSGPRQVGEEAQKCGGRSGDRHHDQRRAPGSSADQRASPASTTPIATTSKGERRDERERHRREQPPAGTTSAVGCVPGSAT